MTLHREIVDFLMTVNGMDSPSGRQSILTYLGYGHLSSQLDFQGATFAFANQLTTVLENRGTSDLCKFLVDLQTAPQVSVDGRAKLEGLVARLDTGDDVGGGASGQAGKLTWGFEVAGQSKTGDYHIDQVQKTLSQLNASDQQLGAHHIPFEALFPELSQLFQRPAFQDHVCRTNEKDMKLLLYAVTATDWVLHSWRPAILKHGAAKYLEDYDALRREVKELGDKVAKAYGETFSLADHKYKHGLYRNSFVEALPDLVDAEKCWEAEPHRQAAVELAHQLFDKK